MSYVKVYKYKQQVSYDQGETWEDTGEYVPSGDPIGYYDTLEECEAKPFEGKFKLTLSDSSTVSAECDSTSAISRSEVSTPYKSTLVSAEIGDCVTSISEYTFEECSSLTSIDIPNSVTSIGYDAFSGCTSLTSVTMPNSVTSIGDGAFRVCISLTSVTIPNSVTSIGYYAFSNCSSLTNITVDSNNIVYDSRNNCNAIIETNTNTLIQGCNSTVIPNSVTAIGNWAFHRCSSLTSIGMPDSVTSIGGNAFSNCSSLTSCTIGTGVTTIGAYAFSWCRSLTSVTIPNSVTSIGNHAFEYCISLTSCTIGSGVTSIGISAFYNCTSLTTVDIPSGVTSIGYYAFYHCSGLTSVTVNATTPPTLGGGALDDTNNCPIYVPCASVDTYKAASGWSTYADRIQGIPPCGQPTFDGKYQLTLSDSSTVSAECDSTSAITSGEVATQYSGTVVSAEIGNCVKSIGNRAFRGCSGLTSVTIPDSVTTIGNASFYICSSLTSIDIPSGVTSIGNTSFWGCTSLTSIDIPSGVTSIGGYAFQNCIGLTSVTVLATTPPTLDVNVFSNTNDCPIYVPASSVNTYKSASGWSTYSSRIQAIP